MKTYIVTFLIGCFICATSVGIAQVEKDTLWFDANWNPSAKNQASYFRPQPEKKGNGFLWKDYFLSGAKQMDAVSLDETKEVFDGTVTWYFESGNVMQLVNYKKGILFGERKNYHESGPLKSQYAYKDALIEGPWVGYFENAKLSESGAYIKGQRDGAWKEYHKDGKLKGEGKYVAGKKVGTWKMYYYDGKSEDE